jgi:penicillin amidase
MMAGKNTLLDSTLGPILHAALRLVSRTRLPRTRGNLSIKGLQGKVEIMRDSWGVAHIYAGSSADVLFAQGFVHAQERLWQMDFTRRVVSGRLAEVLGEAALPFDRAMRTLGLYLTAEQEADKVSGKYRPLLEAYCAGTNAAMQLTIKSHKLPIEFLLLGYQPEPWALADSFKWVKLMSWTLAVNWQSEFMRAEIIRRLGPEKAAELEIDIDRTWAVILDLGRMLSGGQAADATRSHAGPHPDEGVGSNSWVVHGTRTATGKPLLANDMHLELTVPGLWYENHLCGGELEVSGVSLPGAPLIVAGHNRSVAWGFTDGCPDVQDLFEEHLRQTGSGGWEYEFKDLWLPVDVRREEILIKGGKRVVEEVLVTRHGPVINRLFKETFPDAPPLALRWTALDPDDSLPAFYSMNVARDCREFHEALRHFDNPAQNVVYADTQGNIAYTLNGKVPLRAKGDGTVPAPGWSGDHEWTGTIPFEDMPHLFNPPPGFIVTANNQIQRPDYPYILGKDYLVSDRAGRILELLAARTRVDVAYFRQMHSDQVAVSARRLAVYLGGLQVSDPDLQAVVAGMRAWDGKLEVRSPLAAVYEATVQQAIRLLLEHWLGELGVRIQGKGPFAGQWPEHTWEWFMRLLDRPESPWFNLGNGEQRDDVLKLALEKGVQFLKHELGPRLQDWEWGKLHRLAFGHVLGVQKPLDRVFNIGPFPIGGDGNTIAATFTSWYDLTPRPVIGPPFRFIADLADLDHCWGQLVPGQSGHLASQHFHDGVTPWLTGEYHPMLFNRQEIEQRLDGRLILMPGKEEPST